MATCLIAASAAGFMLLGLASPGLALLSLPVQVGGGVAYRWTLDLEPYGCRIFTVQPLPARVYNSRSCIRFSLPNQNSIDSGVIR